MMRLPLLAMLCLIATITGCANHSRPVPAGMPAGSGNGSLIIAGGGTERDNKLIWGRFVDLAAGRKIGIAVTASGVADEAVANSRAALLLHGAKPEQVIELPLRQGDTASADSPATVALIDGLGAVWFTGGDQARITATLMNAGTDRPALVAMRRLVNDRKGVIGGTSAGAAMMSEMMLANGTSDRWLTTLLNDPKAKLPLEQGIGFAQHFITDQHFFARGRTGRLAAALVSGATKTGIGIDENRAVVVDLSTNTVEALGDRAALVLYAGDATAKDGKVGPLTGWLLGNGDTVVLTGTRPIVKPAAGARVWTGSDMPAMQNSPPILPRVPGRGPFATGRGPFDANQIPALLIRATMPLASDPTVAEDAKWWVTAARTAGTVRVADMAENDPATRVHDVEINITRVGAPAVQR